MRRSVSYLLAIMLLLIIPISGHSQQSVFVIQHDSGSYTSLPKYVQTYLDQQASTTIEQVADPSFQPNFSPLNGKVEFEMDKIYWGKFHIRSELKYGLDLFLYTAGGDFIEFYLPAF